LRVPQVGCSCSAPRGALSITSLSRYYWRSQYLLLQERGRGDSLRSNLLWWLQSSHRYFRPEWHRIMNSQGSRIWSRASTARLVGGLVGDGKIRRGLRRPAAEARTCVRRLVALFDLVFNAPALYPRKL